MEQDGWLRSDWDRTERNREARFYSLTAKGKKQLEAEREIWNRLTRGVARVLRHV
jgi:DNA-binding PadR family transcriptional regulator